MRQDASTWTSWYVDNDLSRMQRAFQTSIGIGFWPHKRSPLQHNPHHIWYVTVEVMNAKSQRIYLPSLKVLRVLSWTGSGGKPTNALTKSARISPSTRPHPCRCQWQYVIREDLVFVVMYAEADPRLTSLSTFKFSHVIVLGVSSCRNPWSILRTSWYE